MKIHVLVEGTSEQEFFQRWGPRYLPGHDLTVHPHQGRGQFPAQRARRPDPRRRGLLDQLPMKLRAFGKTLVPHQECVVVLLDTDDDPPERVRAQWNAMLEPIEPLPTVYLALATEELEAFYLGDLRALKRAYPNHDARKAREYVPDSIVGTWELFGRVIGDGGARKVQWAITMGTHLTVRSSQSRSPSFRETCETLDAIRRRSGAAHGKSRKPRKAGAATKRDASGKRRR